jgi:hypothetical protein
MLMRYLFAAISGLFMAVWSSSPVIAGEIFELKSIGTIVRLPTVRVVIGLVLTDNEYIMIKVILQSNPSFSNNVVNHRLDFYR